MKTLFVLTLGIILVLSGILSGCSSSASPTQAPAPVPPPASTSVAAPAPPPASVPAPTSAPMTPTQTSAGPIKIGYISAHSGIFAMMAKYEDPAVQMVIDNVNASGGLLGRQVQLVLRDDQADPSIVVQKADELKGEGVVGIIGTTMDATNEAIASWSAKNKMPIACGTSADITMRTTNFSKYTFFTTPSTWTYAKVLAQSIAKDNSINSIWAICDQMGVMTGTYTAIWDNMKVLKPSVKNLGVIYMSVSDNDNSTVLGTAISKKPDLLLGFRAGPSGPPFILQSVQFNILKQMKVAGIYSLDPSAAAPMGKNFPVGWQTIDTCPIALNTPEMQAFVKEFYKRAQVYPAPSSTAFGLSALALVTAIKNAGSTDPDAIVKAWETMTLPNTWVGNISFRDFDHQGNVPMWYESSGFSPDFPDIAVGVNGVKFQDGIYPTKDEIMAMRSATPTSGK